MPRKFFQHFLRLLPSTDILGLFHVSCWSDTGKKRREEQYLFFSFSIPYSTQLHLAPLKSIVSEDAGIETGTVATLAITAYLLSNKLKVTMIN
jgi:hypothetical protein